MFRFKELNNVNNGTMIYNPCFNKGYYNKELNLTGSGDFNQCYRFINEELKDTDNGDNHHIHIRYNNTIFLDSQFKQFKFLFYDNSQDNIYKLKDQIKYKELRNKVETLCSYDFSALIIAYSRFHISSLSKLCFDATYLITTLDKYDINENTVIKLLNDKSKKINEKDFYNLLLKPNNLLIFLLMLIALVLSFALFFLNNFLVKLLNQKLLQFIWDNKIENDIDSLLKYQKIKNYLFYDANAIFRLKYGQTFELENYDLILIKNDIKDLLDKDKNMKQMVIECENDLINFKSYVFVSLLQIVVLLIFLITFCIFLNMITANYYFIKSVVTVSSLLFVVLVVMISLKALIK
jgi:hypothetical protein